MITEKRELFSIVPSPSIPEKDRLEIEKLEQDIKRIEQEVKKFQKKLRQEKKKVKDEVHLIIGKLIIQAMKSDKVILIGKLNEENLITLLNEFAKTKREKKAIKMYQTYKNEIKF